ncbi:hypothetical protein ANN_13770 [Periplaneta americana]|uniref:Uncharacterized protein n=1 Tax=Periplaneta americana TaxID=6978 RepID=A0ABQ8SUK4_PERAM|nr:hypothetical protein ANN_13770 [Periplaneta americana]
MQSRNSVLVVGAMEGSVSVLEGSSRSRKRKRMSETRRKKEYEASVSDSFKVKWLFFYNIFSTEFNLEFGTPATDTGRYCARMNHEVQSSVSGKKRKKFVLHSSPTKSEQRNSTKF